MPPKGRALVFSQQVPSFLPGPRGQQLQTLEGRSLALHPALALPLSCPAGGHRDSWALSWALSRTRAGPWKGGGDSRAPGTSLKLFSGMLASLQLAVSGPPGPATWLCCLGPAPSCSPAASGAPARPHPTLLPTLALLLLPRRPWARGPQVRLAVSFSPPRPSCTLPEPARVLGRPQLVTSALLTP